MVVKSNNLSHTLVMSIEKYTEKKDKHWKEWKSSMDFLLMLVRAIFSSIQIDELSQQNILATKRKCKFGQINKYHIHKSAEIHGAVNQLLTLFMLSPLAQATVWRIISRKNKSCEQKWKMLLKIICANRDSYKRYRSQRLQTKTQLKWATSYNNSKVKGSANNKWTILMSGRIVFSFFFWMI